MQAEQYRAFNEDIVYLMQLERMREQLKQRILSRAAPETKLVEEVVRVNQGLKYQNLIRKMEKGDYFAEKYNLDH